MKARTTPGSGPENQARLFQPKTIVAVAEHELHTVAFWKTFLEGDHRYMRYLTPGYARSHHLQAVVFKID